MTAAAVPNIVSCHPGDRKKGCAPGLRATHGGGAVAVVSTMIVVGLLIGTHPDSLDSPVFFLVGVLLVVDLASALLGMATWALVARVLSPRRGIPQRSQGATRDY